MEHLAERDAFTILQIRKLIASLMTSDQRAADRRTAEAAGLLAAPCRNPQWNLKAFFLCPLCDQQAGNHAGNAIISAAVNHRIKMRSDQIGISCRIFCIIISCLIRAEMQSELFCLFPEQSMHLIFSIGVAESRDAAIFQCTDRFESLKQFSAVTDLHLLFHRVIPFLMIRKSETAGELQAVHVFHQLPIYCFFSLRHLKDIRYFIDRFRLCLFSEERTHPMQSCTFFPGLLQNLSAIHLSHGLREPHRCNR